MYLYKLVGNKAVHEINPATGFTYCNVERNKQALAKLDCKSLNPPSGRRICGNCLFQKDPKKVWDERASSNVVEKQPKKADRVRRKSNDDFYHSWEWAQLRFEVLLHYGAKCMLCGATNEVTKITVDHIKPRSIYPELELDFKNLQVLCDLCNRGKSRRHEIDFRDKHLEDQINSHMKSILLEG